MWRSRKRSAPAMQRRLWQPEHPTRFQRISGAIYWANIGRVVYGMTEKRLLELTGSDEQNPTFDLPCREVFARGQKNIQVIGPVPEVEEEAAQVHLGYWNK